MQEITINMKTKTTHEKLAELIHNQALETSNYVRSLQPPREITEAELRETLDPNFWFNHNRLLRLLHHETRSLSGPYSSEEELKVGNATVVHLGYIANQDFRQALSEAASNVVLLSDYRLSIANTIILGSQEQVSA